MLNISEAQFARFERFIEEHETFIVVGHKEPDGDCISSSLVLADIIRRRGKKAHVLSAGPFKRTETKKYEPLFASHCETKKKLKRAHRFIYRRLFRIVAARRNR